MGSSPFDYAVFKLNLSGINFWQDNFETKLSRNSLSIDAKELNVYFASSNNPVTVFRLNSSNGAIVSQHKYE